MKAKDRERRKAISLRKLGYSLSEISNKVKVSKSSVSVWVRRVNMGQKAQERIIYLKKMAIKNVININHRNAVLRKKKCNNWAKKFLMRKRSFSIFENRMIYSLLYWGEGAKFSNGVEFTNSDPKMVKMFLISLIIGFGVDRSKIKVNLHLHKYHNGLKQKKMWCDLLEISENQFNKTYWKPNSDKIKRLNYPGCIRICYYSKEIVDKIKAFYSELFGKIGS